MKVGTFGPGGIGRLGARRGQYELGGGGGAEEGASVEGSGDEGNAQEQELHRPRLHRRRRRRPPPPHLAAAATLTLTLLAIPFFRFESAATVDGMSLVFLFKKLI
jgi:hypothetical protein